MMKKNNSKKAKANRRLRFKRKAYHRRFSFLDLFKFLSLATILATGIYGTIYFFYNAQIFTLQKVQIEGKLSRLTQEQAIELAQVPQKNIFTLNLLRITQNLKRFNWIKEVSIRRDLPHSLKIFIEEYQPQAILIFDASESFFKEPAKQKKTFEKLVKAKKAYFVDDQAKLITVVSLRDLKKNVLQEYPVIIGFKKQDLKTHLAYWQKRLTKVIDYQKGVQKILTKHRYTLKHIRFSKNRGIDIQACIKKTSYCSDIEFGLELTQHNLTRLDHLFVYSLANRLYHPKISLVEKTKIFAKPFAFSQNP